MSQTPLTTSNVDWANTHHAYGPATDIPDLLRMLESDEPSERENAMWELCGNVFHQGTRYPSSAIIVPFLVALAANPAIQDRDEIIRLICSIALGYDVYFLPEGMALVSQQRELEERRNLDVEAEKRKLDQWVAEAVNEKQRRRRQAWHNMRLSQRSHDLQDMENGMAAYEAVRNHGLPTLCSLLKNDSDSSVRVEAAHILAFFAESADEILPFLRPIVFEDSDSIPAELLATAIISFALLYATSPAPDYQTVEQRLQHFLTSENASLRWAAATGLSRLESVDAAVIYELVFATIDEEPDTDPRIPFHTFDRAGYALISLKAVYAIPSLSDSILKSAIGPILDGLSKPFLWCDADLLPIACKILWKTPESSPFKQDNPLAFQDLPTELEKLVVKSLAQISHSRWPYFKATLKLWSLPLDRDSCRRYVGLPEEGPYTYSLAEMSLMEMSDEDEP